MGPLYMNVKFDRDLTTFWFAYDDDRESIMHTAMYSARDQIVADTNVSLHSAQKIVDLVLEVDVVVSIPLRK